MFAKIGKIPIQRSFKLTLKRCLFLVLIPFLLFKFNNICGITMQRI